MFRILLSIAVAAFPAFALTKVLINTTASESIWMPLVFSATAATLLAGTYYCPWVRARISRLMSVFLCIISYWYVALAYWSAFSPESSVGLIVVFAAAGIGTSFWIENPAAVSVYMVSIVVAVGVCVYATSAPGLDASIMVLACIGVSLVIYLAVTSRAKADEDIYAQHGLLRSLFDESTDAHVLFDSRTGQIIDFNQAALDLLEVSDTMLAARTLDWRSGLRVLDVDGPIEKRTVEQRQRKCKARSGRIFWAEVSTRNLHVDDLEVTLLKMVDVTQKRKAAQTAILDARRAASVAELSTALTRAEIDDADPMQIVTRTVTRSHADLCIVCSLTDEDGTIRPAAISHRNPQTEDVLREWAAVEPVFAHDGVIGKVISTGESVIVNDELTDIPTAADASNRHRFIRNSHLRTAVVHPLKAFGSVVGAILFSRDTQKRPFSDHDREYFRDVAEKAAWAIANARLLGAVKRGEARFRSLVQNSSDLILLLDGEAKIQYASPSAKRILGCEADELIGEHVISLAHPRDVAGLLNESTRIRDGQDVVVNASRFRHAGGEWRWLEAVAVNMLNDENVRGVVINARDVTERIRYEEELRDARDVAEEMVRLKDAFLANMSHEIRTPLTAILGFSSVLGDELDAEHREFIGHIHSNGTRLMDALNSVLDLARLEAGGVALELSEVDIQDAVDEAIAAFSSLAVDRGLYLESSISFEEKTLRLDRSCLARILTNLLGNAIRFTEDGGVRVDVRRAGNDVEISVEDTGIGIGEEFLPYLFKPFRQESSGFARSHEGTGLGLAITQRLVEIMGGRIDVESRRGAGSAFRVRFPITADAVSAPKNGRTVKASAKSKAA